MTSQLDEFQDLRTPAGTRVHYKVYYEITRPETLRYISDEITIRLNGVMPGRNIIVPDEQIISVLDSFYQNIPADSTKLVMMTISYIVQHIRTEMQQEAQNNKLSIWVQNKPEYWGIQHHDEIKLSRRRPTSFQIGMRY